MKRILLLSFILFFAHSSFAATEGKFIQKDNMFPRVEIVTTLEIGRAHV